MEELRDIGQTQNNCALRGWPIRPVDLALFNAETIPPPARCLRLYRSLFQPRRPRRWAEFQSFEVVNLGLAQLVE